jgi:hypothetical protein
MQSHPANSISSKNQQFERPQLVAQAWTPIHRCHGDSWCGTDCITFVPKAGQNGLARSAKCLIRRTTNPAPDRGHGTELPILFHFRKPNGFSKPSSISVTSNASSRGSTVGISTGFLHVISACSFYGGVLVQNSKLRTSFLSPVVAEVISSRKGLT